ncbi:hypothetical protein [Paenibacillus sp. DMB20]|uniref:hypothetical protein n=1 Tax=Paenibacillus sp. DMB20 TaxID=1642570 RepID=UPI000B135AA4|nr:hypothetical protein [Paenibacillus sp. DMB20]
MDIKSSVKHRRQVRIKEILEKRAPGENLEFQTHKPAVKNGKVFDDIQQPRLSKPDTDTLPPEMEPDPEKLWKQGYRGWYDASPDAPPPRKKFSFVGSMLRRITVSALLFGAVWGIFFDTGALGGSGSALYHGQLEPGNGFSGGPNLV